MNKKSVKEGTKCSLCLLLLGEPNGIKLQQRFDIRVNSGAEWQDSQEREWLAPGLCCLCNDTGLGEQARQASPGGSEIVSGEPVQPSFLGVVVRKAIFL